MKIGRFPEVVNENAARLVASIICCLAVIAILHPAIYTILPLLYGFTARVLYGPDYSPAAQFVLKAVIPLFKIENRPTPGAPKRFAQFIGFLFTLTAAILFSLNLILEFQIVLSILVFFAFLESSLGFCAGCFVFSYLIKWGFVPQEICERCSNLEYHI
jgi:hypothetical protein